MAHPYTPHRCTAHSCMTQPLNRMQSEMPAVHLWQYSGSCLNWCRCRFGLTLRFVADPRFTRRPTNSPGPQSAAWATWPGCSNRSGCWTSLTASSTKRRSERSTPVLSLGPRQWGVGVGAHEAGRKITQLFNSAISKLGFWTNGPLRVLATKRGFV